MRRLTFILLALVAGFTASARGRLRVDESLGLGYNRSYGMYREESTMVHLDLWKNIGLRGGLKFQDSSHSLELGARYRLSDALGIEGFYMGEWSKTYNFKDRTAGILAVWNWHERLEVKAGTFFRKLSPISGTGSVSEPLNFAYGVGFWALDTGKRFNIGASISNLDMFTAERFYCPLLTIKAKYLINQKLLVYAQFRQHNSGTFDLTSNLFDRQFRIGTIIWW